MALPAGAVTTSFQLGGQNITSQVRTFGGWKVNDTTVPNKPYGTRWRRHAPVGKSGVDDMTLTLEADSTATTGILNVVRPGAGLAIGAATVSFVVTTSTGDMVTFPVHVTSRALSTPEEDLTMYELTLQVDGAPTFAGAFG